MLSTFRIELFYTLYTGQQVKEVCIRILIIKTEGANKYSWKLVQSEIVRFRDLK